MVYYGVKNACKMAFYKKSDGSLAAYFPFGNSMSINVTGDSVEAQAQGSTIITWASNRRATATINTQTISSRLMAIVLGATTTTESSGNIIRFQTGKIGTSSATFTLDDTPATSTLSVFITEDDGATVKSELTSIGSNPSETQYSITDKVITVNSAHAGKPILCIYGKAGTNIEKVTVSADKFAEAYEIKALGLVKTVNGEEKLQEIHIPNATAQTNADFTYDASNPSDFSFTFDLASDPVTMELFSFRSV